MNDVESAIFAILYIIVAIFFFWKMLIDAFRHKNYGWAVFIIFFNIFAGITYYFAVYKLRSPYDRN